MTSCFGCTDSRDTCGPTYSSSCIWYTGQLPKFIIADNKLCKANVNDVFKAYGDKLDFLNDQSNVKSLDKKTFGYDQANITPLALMQTFINKISTLESDVYNLKAALKDLNIGSLPITLDLGMLAPDASACEISPNTYPLQALLNIIINKLSC